MTHRILLVEDNPKDEMLMLRAIKKNDFDGEVMVVRDGAEAIDYLISISIENKKELPDIIFLDLKLPKMGGFQVLEQIRAHLPTQRLPVVILSSSDESADITKSYQLGANSYVCKPVDFAEYNNMVAALVRYWLADNHFPPPLPENMQQAASNE
ncbi:MAG: response regulator [Pseudomonadota bacterium]